MINQEDHTLINKYLDNQLDEKELKDFENRLSQEETLAKELALAKSMNSFLKHNEGANTVIGYIDEIGKKYRNENKVIPLYKRRNFLMSVAASIALLIAAIPLLKNFSSSHYEQFAEHRLLSGEQGEVELDLTNAIKLYNNKEYGSALEIFERLIPGSGDYNPEFELAKGICHLELDQFTEAESSFNNLILTQAIYKNEANWYLALTALKQEKYAECKTFLQKIDAGSSYQKKAEALLATIE